MHENPLEVFLELRLLSSTLRVAALSSSMQELRTCHFNKFQGDTDVGEKGTYSEKHSSKNKQIKRCLNPIL